MPYAPDTPDTAVSAAPAPAHPGMHTLHPAVSELRPLINWKAFTAAWRTSSCSAEATHLKDDAESVLDRLEDRGARLTARLLLCPAHSEGLDIHISSGDASFTIPTIRKAAGGDAGASRPALADFIAPADDWTGIFAVTTAGDVAD